MQLVACSSVTAVGAVIAAGMVTAAPATMWPAAPGHSILLTAGLAGPLDAQLNANSALIEGFLAANAQLVDAQHELTPSIAAVLGGDVHPDGSVHGLAKDAVEQFFNATNALTGASQGSLLGLLGARGTVHDGAFAALNLAAINESLLVDPQHAGSIPFAGLESAIGHYIGAAVFLGGAFSGSSGDDIETGAAGANFARLVADVVTFNSAVLAAEQTFNSNLVADELGLERAMFGTDSAYNGLVNRVFNAFNMMYDAQQQSFNGTLGLTGYDPQEYTEALLTGSGGADGQIFNDGNVGGLLATFDQSVAAVADLDGLFRGVSTGIPDGFEPDPTAVADAFRALGQTVGGGPFGDVFTAGGSFSDLMAGLQSLFASAVGS